MKLSNQSFFLCSLVAALSACNSGGGSGGGGGGVVGAFTISGSLEVPSLVMGRGINQRDINPVDVNLSNFTVTCVTISSNPQSASSAVGIDGSFSVSLPGAEGSKITCNVLNNTGLRATDEDVVAGFVVVDDSEKDINGNDKTYTSVALEDDADFGNIALDLESGKAEIDKDNIADVIVTEAASEDSYWDATGTWTFDDLETVPAGYKKLCEPEDKSNDCFGPARGESVYIRQVNGKKYENDAPTDEDRYGILVWRNQSAYENCSGGPGMAKLGTTFESLQELGVDFSDSGLIPEAFSFVTSLDGLDTLTDGYKSDAATASWDIKDCRSYEFPFSETRSANSWLCHDSTNDTYQINLSGGCVVTETNEPFQPNDWSNVSWGGCTSSSDDRYPGFIVNTCSATFSESLFMNVPLTCTNVYAFSSSSTPTPGTIDNEVTFDWNEVGQVVAQGALCSSIGPGNELDQARCYAEYYQRYTKSNEVSGCLRRIETNWSATSVEDFIQQSDRPESQHVAAFYELDATGIGSLHDENEFFNGVRAGDTWVNCRVRESFTLNLAPSEKEADEVVEAIGTFETEQSLIDKDKPACVAFMKDNGGVKKDLGNGVVLWVLRSKHMFKMSRAELCKSTSAKGSKACR